MHECCTGENQQVTNILHALHLMQDRCSGVLTPVQMSKIPQLEIILPNGAKMRELKERPQPILKERPVLTPAPEIETEPPPVEVKAAENSDLEQVRLKTIERKVTTDGTTAVASITETSELITKAQIAREQTAVELATFKMELVKTSRSLVPWLYCGAVGVIVVSFIQLCRVIAGITPMVTLAAGAAVQTVVQVIVYVLGGVVLFGILAFLGKSVIRAGRTPDYEDIPYQDVPGKPPAASGERTANTVVNVFNGDDTHAQTFLNRRP